MLLFCGCLLFCRGSCLTFGPCVCPSGVFKYPEHVARETGGEMEPTDLKLSTGDGRLLFDCGSRGLVYQIPVITLPPPGSINGLLCFSS